MKLLTFTSATCVMLLSVLVSLAVISKDKPSTKQKSKSKISKRDLWLAQAQINMSAKQFWIATFFCGLVTFVIVSAFSQTPLVAGALSIGAAYIPYLFIAKKHATISNELINAWPDALRDINANISSGYSLSHSLKALSVSGPKCIAEPFSRFATLEATMGFAGACENIRGEMNDPTTDRIIEVLIVAHERGGKIIREILDNLIEETMEDIALRESIESESTEMKINSRAVVILPWCVLLVLTFSGSAFRDFYQSPAGAIVILVGAALSALGIVILSRLTKIEDEPRVFAYVKDVS